MTGNMRLLRPDDAADALREGFGFQQGLSDSSYQDQVIAEYVRQAIFDLASRSSSSRRSTYVTSVTNNVRRQLAPVWPRLERRRNQRPLVREQEREGDVVPDPIRRVLEALEDLGDVVHLADGYWAPTPTRLVRLNERIALVVGGAPTRVARTQIPAPISPSWIARTVDLRTVPDAFAADSVNWQDTKSWLGNPPEDLSEWTTSMFVQARAQQKRSGSEIQDFEIYQPASNRSRPQAFRWTPARMLARAPKDLVLCRAFEGRHFGLRRHWIGMVSKSRSGVRSESEFAVPGLIVRRLQYGIDLLQRAYTSARVEETGSSVSINFVNPLPPEERRLLVSLGEDRSPRPGKFPLRYRLNRSAFTALVPYLTALGVRVETE
jgi:hypothetical protein